MAEVWWETRYTHGLKINSHIVLNKYKGSNTNFIEEKACRHQVNRDQSQNHQ